MAAKPQRLGPKGVFVAALCVAALLRPSIAPADRFEPDNSAGEARLLIVNDPKERHEFATAGDEDWYLFFGLGNFPYSVRATSVSAACDAHMTVFYDDGLTTVAVRDFNPEGVDEEWTSLSLVTGFYYVRLRNADPLVFGPGISYAIEVDQTTGATTGSAHAISPTEVLVQWVVVPPYDFIGWHVFRSTSRNPRDLVRINPATIPPQQNSYIDGTVVGGLSYYYVVKKEITTGVVEASAGLFAGIPIETVDERTVGLQPSAGVSPLALVIFKPGPLRNYTNHEIRFYGYTEVATGTDIDVKIRSVKSAEREATGQSFPARSDALFIIETVRWVGGTPQPYRFTDPVDIVIQFAPPHGPIRAGWYDVVNFSNQDATTGQMRAVRDMIDGPGVDFQFLNGLQTLDGAAHTVTLRIDGNDRSLTDSSGQAAYGVVACEGGWCSACTRWQGYR